MVTEKDLAIVSAKGMEWMDKYREATARAGRLERWMRQAINDLSCGSQNSDGITYDAVNMNALVGDGCAALSNKGEKEST